MLDWDKETSRLIAPDEDFKDFERQRNAARAELANAVVLEIDPGKTYIVRLDEKVFDNFGAPGYRLLKVRMHVQKGKLKGVKVDD